MAKTPQYSKHNDVPLPPSIKGTRRLVREKAMQLLSAQEVSGVHWRDNFLHIFPFEYRLEEAATPNRLLTEEEIERLEKLVDDIEDDLATERQFNFDRT
jgi:hypothetical protein